jgi:hypothetical protein
VGLYIAHVGVDPPGVTAPAVVADWTVGCTVARSHGTRAASSESRAERTGLSHEASASHGVCVSFT